jgi:hypothetical protein
VREKGEAGEKSERKEDWESEENPKIGNEDSVEAAVEKGEA